MDDTELKRKLLYKKPFSSPIGAIMAIAFINPKHPKLIEQEYRWIDNKGIGHVRTYQLTGLSHEFKESALDSLANFELINKGVDTEINDLIISN